MERFPSADHFASWAGVAPGNHESAGQRTSGKARNGNRFLRTTLVQAAHAAARRCDRQQSTVPAAEGRLEPCTICTNMARTPQAVHINKTEHTVPAEGHVAMCETMDLVTCREVAQP